jgi:hypothetical protein
MTAFDQADTKLAVLAHQEMHRHQGAACAAADDHHMRPIAISEWR